MYSPGLKSGSKSSRRADALNVRMKTRHAVLLLILLTGMLFSMPVLASSDRAVIYAREGHFLLFQGESQTPFDVSRHRIIYTEVPSPRYETEALLPNGRWHVVSRDDADRLLEIQTFEPKRMFLLDTDTPLYSQPSPHAKYKLDKKAAPELYAVSRKAYDFVELNLADGTTGWIRLPENDTAFEYTAPGRFTGQLTTLDHRIAGDLVIKTEIAPLASRVQTEMIPQYVTVHNASNFESYATAEWHAYQFSILTFMPGVTYHYVVDDKQAFLLTPLNEATYNAGDRFLNGNGASVAIEICDYANGRNYPAAEQNGAKLAAAILYQLGLPKENLRYHRDWNGKECPLSMIQHSRGSVGLEAFTELVYAEYEALVMTYGQTYAPPSESASPEAAQMTSAAARETIQRESVIRETNERGIEVTRIVTEVIHVDERPDYGALPYVAGGLFILTAAGGIVYSIRRNRKPTLPFDR